MQSGLADVLADMFDRGQDLYAILGVPETADLAAIKKAYRRRALECHPDRYPDDLACEERFKQIQAAYEVLSNPVTRVVYDMQRGSSWTGVSARQSAYRSARQPGVDYSHVYVSPPHVESWEEMWDAYVRETPEFDFSRAPNVGPYMGVSFNQVMRKPKWQRGWRNFRVIIYGAHGIHGSLDNGVAVLDEDKHLVLADRMLAQVDGYKGSTGEQRRLVGELIRMPTEEFRQFINRQPYAKYTLDANLNIESEQ